MAGVVATSPGGGSGNQADESRQERQVAQMQTDSRQPTSSTAALSTQHDTAVVSGSSGCDSTSQPGDLTSGSAHADKQANEHTTSGDDAPACLLACRDRVEACSHRLQAWSDAKEVEARERKVRRRDHTDGGVRIEADGSVVEARGEGLVQRKGIIVLVAVILSWVYVAYGWRVCANAIRRDPRATATRSEGIGLLVAFNILWLMAIWSYVKVVTTAPGFVRDHIPITDPPTSTQEYEFRFPHSVLPVVQVPREQQLQAQAAQTLPQTQAAPAEDGQVDSTLAAAVGPIGAGFASRAEEASNVQAASPEQPTQPQDDVATLGEKRADASDVMMDVLAPTPFYPEPIRMPRTAQPLHPSATYCYRCRRHKPPRAHHCRHCGTCVLKMDHHCPWVGGCVGARNHKFFFHFLQWVSLLEWFVLITNAVLFRRGIVRPGWSVDGYMISLFPIATVFAVFTTSLIVMHAYLFVYNLSTIEHMGYERQKTREDILIENYLCERRERDGTPKPSWLAQTRQRHAMKAKWDDFWGDARTENNPWWLDGRRAPTLVTLPTPEDVAAPDVQQTAAVSMASDVVQRMMWWQAVGTNWREVMGDSVLGWVLPIGRGRNADGLQWSGNWRFGRLGDWDAAAAVGQSSAGNAVAVTACTFLYSTCSH